MYLCQSVCLSLPKSSKNHPIHASLSEYLAHSECLSQVPEEDVCRDRYKREIIRATKTSKKVGWVEIFMPNGSVGTLELCK